ncbi:reverse transcriptase domain-containing protein [Tanacetum coccineum]
MVLQTMILILVLPGAAWTWLEKEPPNSITTWNDLGEVEKEPETLMDEVHITSTASTAHVPPPGIQPVSPPKLKEDPKPNPYQPKIPYPSRLNKSKLLDKNDVQVSKFLKILKQLQNKEKLEELPNTLINAECSAILLNKVSEKLGDPGKFLILCIAEDVIVKVDKFNFLADFIIVDFEADLRVPIILGRPFLRTAKALVGLYKEKLTIRIGNEELVFRAEIFLKNSPSHEQKSSGSTISHFDPSLLEYESFYFDLSIDPFPLAERSDFYPKEFADEIAHIISPPEYDHFYFDIEADPGELTRLLIENSSSESVNLDKIMEDDELKSKTSTKELTIHELNVLHILLSNCDSTFFEEFLEIDPLVSFPFGNKDKIFDPGILIINGVYSKRSHILPLNDFLLFHSSVIFFSFLIHKRLKLSYHFPQEMKTKFSFPGSSLSIEFSLSRENLHIYRMIISRSINVIFPVKFPRRLIFPSVFTPWIKEYGASQASDSLINKRFSGGNSCLSY